MIFFDALAVDERFGVLAHGACTRTGAAVAAVPPPAKPHTGMAIHAAHARLAGKAVVFLLARFGSNAEAAFVLGNCALLGRDAHFPF